MSQLDSLAVGDVIAIVENRRHPTDKSWQGHPLRVEAIDAPFLAVSDIHHKRPYGRISLDSRQFVFMKLSESYVSAFVGLE